MLSIGLPVLAILVVAVLGATWLQRRDPLWLVRLEFARQRRAAGLRRGTVQAAGHRWVYAHRDGPDGAPLVVMLHGFTGSKENWYPLVRALGDRYALLVPDLPGWGESERRADATYGFVEQAARAADFLHVLAPGRSVVLLGHSMGGGIAALVAARTPERVAAVGLLNAAGVRFHDNAFGLGVLAGGNPFAVEDAASLRRYVDAVFFDARAKPWIPWPAATGLIAQRRRDAAFEQAVLDHIGRGDDSLRPGEEAAHIRQPTLLLWCRQDAVIDPSALDLYAARIPHARKVLLDGCGHMSLAERPRAVADAVVDWIEASRPGRDLPVGARE
jgi:pimeloyl-ACP methyl ester carboxylesterase